MKTSKINVLVSALFLFSFLLAACGSAPAVSQPVEEPMEEAESEPVTEPTLEPTAEPTPVPEIEPEIVDLGNGVRLLLRGLPEGITLDASLIPEFKDNVPTTKNFDYVHTDTV